MQTDKTDWFVEATRELCNLLDILLAIWDDPTLFCPCEIWLKLAKAFHQHLFCSGVNSTDELKRTVPRAQDLVRGPLNSFSY
jgi:hypothetical protein